MNWMNWKINGVKDKLRNKFNQGFGMPWEINRPLKLSSLLGSLSSVPFSSPHVLSEHDSSFPAILKSPA